MRHGVGMFDPVEKLKEFIRHQSVSADSKCRAGMQGAQQFVADLRTFNRVLADLD